MNPFSKISANSLMKSPCFGDSDSPHDRDQIAQIEGTLDQCWDLLRQRPALREFARDSSEITVRSIGTVEHYEQ